MGDGGLALFRIFVVVVVVVVLVGVLVVDALIAREFYDVADMKGYNEPKYFWIAFFLTVIGYLLVIALPDRRNTVQTAKPQSVGLPKL